VGPPFLITGVQAHICDLGIFASVPLPTSGLRFALGTDPTVLPTIDLRGSISAVYSAERLRPNSNDILAIAEIGDGHPNVDEKRKLLAMTSTVSVRRT